MAKELITWEYTQGIIEAIGFKIYRNDTLIADVDITAREYEDDVTEIVDNATKFSDFQSIYKIRAYDIDNNLSIDIAKVKTTSLTDIYADMEDNNYPYNKISYDATTLHPERNYMLFSNVESYSRSNGGYSASNWKIDVTISLDEANTIFGLGYLVGQIVGSSKINDLTLKGYNYEDKTDIKVLSIINELHPVGSENEDYVFPLIIETATSLDITEGDTIINVTDSTLFDIDSTFTIINDNTIYNIVSINNNKIECTPAITMTQIGRKKLFITNNSKTYKNYNFIINGTGLSNQYIGYPNRYSHYNTLINTLHLLGKDKK